jgi:hypothetical protein
MKKLVIATLFYYLGGATVVAIDLMNLGLGWSLEAAWMVARWPYSALHCFFN